MWNRSIWQSLEPLNFLVVLGSQVVEHCFRDHDVSGFEDLNELVYLDLLSVFKSIIIQFCHAVAVAVKGRELVQELLPLKESSVLFVEEIENIAVFGYLLRSDELHPFCVRGPPLLGLIVIVNGSSSEDSAPYFDSTGPSSLFLTLRRITVI